MPGSAKCVMGRSPRRLFPEHLSAVHDLVKVDDLAESLPNVGQQAERSAWPSFREFYRHQCTFRFWSADASATPSSRDQQKLPGRFAAFEIAMSLLRFGQRISMRNSDLELPVRNHVEDRA